MFNRLFGRKQASDDKTIEIVQDLDTDALEEDKDEEYDEDEEEEEDKIRESVYAWGAEWAKTPGFETLPPEQKDESEFILESFANYMYTYQGVAPEAWNSADMEECCLSILPRKVSAEEVYFRSIAPVLASFFRFLGQTSRLRNGLQLADRVEKLAPRIVQASQNPRNWGMAKSFVMKAKSAGVDPTNAAELDAFIVLQNAPMAEQRDSFPDMVIRDIPASAYVDTPDIPYQRPGLKVGRNDPCPCGSGNKYKKCCGSVS